MFTKLFFSLLAFFHDYGHIVGTQHTLINYIKGIDAHQVQHRMVPHFCLMSMGDKPMKITGFSSFLKIIVATARVLDAAGISKFVLNTFA